MSCLPPRDLISEEIPEIESRKAVKKKKDIWGGKKEKKLPLNFRPASCGV